VEELAALLRNNGVGQAAAYLKTKSPDLYGELQRWVCGSTEGTLDLVDWLGQGRDRYIQAVEDSWRLCEWLKLLAVAYLPERPPQQEAGDARGAGGGQAPARRGRDDRRHGRDRQRRAG
jgi:hypothetical protein